jgi:hypothetical protein
MKHYILCLLLIVYSILEAQNIYVPFKKTKKSTTHILLDNPKDVSRCIKKPGKLAACEGVRLNTRELNKKMVSTFILFLQSQPAIKELEIVYHHEDSLDFTLLASLRQLESLVLQNDHRVYHELNKLAGLKTLNKLSLFVDSIQQVPVSVTQLAALGELNLCDDKNCSLPLSDLYFYYPLNDTLYNAMEINGYSESLDLSDAVVKRHFMNLWPAAEEKRPLYLHDDVNSGASMLNAIDAVAAYQLPVALKPLVPGEKQVFEKKLINPLMPHVLVCNDQSVISVPEDAFVTKSGKPVGEDVSLLYRSVRTPADMMRTGVTMFYDTAGQKEMFRTNGMFEIRAFSGNEELALKKGKEIGVEFRANADTGNFNFYTLNDASNIWTYTSSVFQVPARKISYSYMTDKTEFADRYDDLSYTYLLPKNIESGSVEVPYLSNRKVYANDLFRLSGKSKRIRKGKNLVKLKVLTEFCNNMQGKVVFSIASVTYTTPYSEGVRYAYFPELKPLENIMFEFDGSVKTTEFARLYKKGKFYTDCRVYYEINADQAVIELKTKDAFIRIPVKALLTNAKGKTRPNTQLKSGFRRYARLLAIKESKFNQTVSRLVTLRSVDTAIYSSMVMLVAPNAGITGNSFYRLNIPLLGFFNCDQIYRIKQPMIMVNTIFKSGDTVLNNLNTAYVVDADAKGTYTYTPYHMILSYDNTSGIVLQSVSGDIYTCKGNDFRQQVKSSGNCEDVIIRVEKMEKKSDPDALVDKL